MCGWSCPKCSISPPYQTGNATTLAENYRNSYVHVLLPDYSWFLTGKAEALFHRSNGFTKQFLHFSLESKLVDTCSGYCLGTLAIECRHLWFTWERQREGESEPGQCAVVTSLSLGLDSSWKWSSLPLFQSYPVQTSEKILTSPKCSILLRLICGLWPFVFSWNCVSAVRLAIWLTPKL